MILKRRRHRVRRRVGRTIGLTVRGRSNPEIYHVCEDVFKIIAKMVSANQAIGPYSRYPQFDFAEVQFVLDVRGAPANGFENDGCSCVDLWIAEE